MAIENPQRLVIWEAQFGDFYNGAQMIIDQMIASGEGRKIAKQNNLLFWKFIFKFDTMAKNCHEEIFSCRKMASTKCSNASASAWF